MDLKAFEALQTVEALVVEVVAAAAHLALVYVVPNNTRLLADSASANPGQAIRAEPALSTSLLLLVSWVTAIQYGFEQYSLQRHISICSTL